MNLRLDFSMTVIYTLRPIMCLIFSAQL
jgi:hypothetical protein